MYKHFTSISFSVGGSKTKRTEKISHHFTRARYHQISGAVSRWIYILWFICSVTFKHQKWGKKTNDTNSMVGVVVVVRRRRWQHCLRFNVLIVRNFVICERCMHASPSRTNSDQLALGKDVDGALLVQFKCYSSSWSIHNAKGHWNGSNATHQRNLYSVWTNAIIIKSSVMCTLSFVMCTHTCARPRFSGVLSQ